jgi:putative salt-induced outer membrane protein YdiY
MKLYSLGLICGCLLQATLASAAIIHLENGDRITGEVVTEGPENVSVKTSFGSEVQIPIALIANVEGHELAAKIETVAEIVAAPVAAAPEPEPEPIKSIYEWKGRADLGSTFSRGNTDSQTVTLNASYKLKHDKHRYSLDLRTLREEKESEETKNQDRLGLGYNYLFRPKWFFAVDATFERDPIALLDRRMSINPAIGYDVWAEDTRTLNFQLGAGLASEETNNESDSGAVIDWRLEYAQALQRSDLKVFHNHQIYRSMEGRKNAVFNSQSGVRYDITADIFLNVQLNYDYDTEPAPGTDSEDVTFVVGAGMNF